MTTPVQQAIEALRAEFGARLNTSVAVRDQHGRGEAFAAGLPARCCDLAGEHR